LWSVYLTKYYWSYQIKKNKMGGHVARMGVGEVHTGLWWRKLRERNHLEDGGCRWEDNIKMDVQQLGWGGMDWIDLGQDRDRWRAVVNAVMNLHVS
jgi:hypothetical protein